ncbi:MAG: VTT domain-containing protein [Pseudomonadota bacterium]|uniref:VTT domain-containing protein n=1 Tax=Thermithiobacillus tepidarius TaxID=929 RepID=UPI0003FC51B5|nr:VTT domain-containing protein [Thermithiobacillus tepidarius]
MTKTSILAEGRNCWRLAPARRAAFLVDGDAYFRAFAAAVAQARESIYILGWDIDSRLQLRRDDGPRDLPVTLGDFLNTLVSRRRGLRAYLLGWDFAMIYVFEREPFPLYKLDWRTHRRLHFRLDGRHPVGASHHQKVVVVDDALAFVGGFDLAIRRWDTPAHRADEPRRVDPAGVPYPPFHDVQMAVDGAAAAALGELARERWRRATGRYPRTPQGVGHDPWPGWLRPDLENVQVAIARTEPAYQDHPEIREIQALHLDAIAAARHFIYIENQYFTSSLIAEALAARLQEPDGPEVVMVLPERQSGWLEDSTMGVLRARVLRRLREADRHGRLRVYFPTVPGLGEHCIGLHSKILVVDDVLVRVGSSNLSNRSMGFDTECDLAVESGDDARIAAGIARFRDRLLGEHLEVEPARLAERIAAEQSLIRAVASLRGGERTLQPLEVSVSESLDHLVPDAPLIDPESPEAPERLLKDFLPAEFPRQGKHKLLRFAVLLTGLAALAAAWHWTPLRDWLNVRTLARLAASLGEQPLAPLFVIGAYLLGSVAMVPITLLIVATALAFGPWLGFGYSLLGALLGAALTYAIGHLLGRDTVRRLGGSRLNRLSRQLGRQGVLAMAVVRLLPVAPFTIVNMVAGASHIRFREFVIGTLLGMSPGILAITVFGNQLANAITNPGAKSYAVLAVVVVLIVLAVLAVRRWLAKDEARAAEFAKEGEHV